MSSYASIKDVQLRYPTRLLAQLTDEEAGKTMEPTRIQKALDDACAEIDSYLGSQFTLPLDPVMVATNQSLLTRLTVDMAVFRLMSFRTQGATEDARLRYEDAIKTLEKINKGSLTLGPGAGQSLIPTQGGAAVAGGVSAVDPGIQPNTVFSDRAMAGYLRGGLWSQL